MTSAPAVTTRHAFLLYVAAVWLGQDTTGTGRTARMARVRDLVRQARSAALATRTTWMQEMPEVGSLTSTGDVDLTDVDALGVAAIVARLQGRLNAAKVTAELSEVVDRLAQTEAVTYEQGLTALGKMLGAEALKPPGKGRCDSAWLWGMALWATVEAKSEQHEDGLLPLKDIRQANTQLDQLAHDRSVDHAPAGSPAILVSDRLTADPQHAAAANPNVYLTGQSIISEIAADAQQVWQQLLTSGQGVTGESRLRALVTDVMTHHGCLPSQVIDRLTQNRIRPLD